MFKCKQKKGGKGNSGSGLGATLTLGPTRCVALFIVCILGVHFLSQLFNGEKKPGVVFSWPSGLILLIIRDTVPFGNLSLKQPKFAIKWSIRDFPFHWLKRKRNHLCGKRCDKPLNDYYLKISGN